MKKDRVILHLDMDAFFASCEQANNPFLKNKPVMVSRDKDKSIITAASYECRAYGVKAGLPVFKAKQLLKNVEYFVVPGSYEMYEKYSKKIFETIKSEFTIKVEIVGTDECYIDATDIWMKYGSVKNLCLAIQAAVYQKTTLTCSIGASFNKMLAKMASDMNKPNGIQIITRENFKTLIWEKPIDDVIGVGKSFHKITEKLKIKTVADFVKLDDSNVIKIFGKSGFKMKNALLGNSTSNIDYLSNEIKSISKSKKLTYKTNFTVNDIEIKNLLFDLTKSAHYKLLEEKSKIKTIQLIIKFYDQNDEKINLKTYSHTIEEYTDNFEIIYSILETKLNELSTTNFVSLIGVGLSNILKNDKITIQSKFEF